MQLQGIIADSPQVQEVELEQVYKWSKGNDIWVVAIVEAVQPTPAQKPIPAVHELLEKFKDVFQTPTELPPSRFYDHQIPLLPGAVPVNSRPYRYSPKHKDEIERQVKELLAVGLTTPSTSPFASPVLLVQKKDGSCRFCVDYGKLNSITIKNRFPMPLIEEILDELVGTQYFTKLDMRSGYH